MGLDTQVYSGLQLVRATEEYEDGPNPWIYVNPSFVANAGGLVTGIYSHMAKHPGVSHSYIGHSRMRDMLCQAIHGMDTGSLNQLHRQGVPGVQERAFGWLLVMSDCEGTIGGMNCVTLASDFNKHWNTLETYAWNLPGSKAMSAQGEVPYDDGEHFLHWCKLWRESATLAGASGGIVFR